jgi:glycosyltransferase involved in cell wall biosynthesis
MDVVAMGCGCSGDGLIRRYRPDALWSTYPIATAHQIGAILNRRSGLPWIADFRDPMAQEGYPADPKTWQCYRAIEETAFRKARFSVFTTPSAAKVYRERYPEVPPERAVLIENGYDEESFAGLEVSAAAKGPLNPGRITLLHSGVVYPSERNPTQLFRAMRALRDSGRFSTTEFVLRLRATAHDEWLRSLATEHGIAEFIEWMPPLPYREALEEMVRADGLVVLQADSCNAQIPAKLYEYLRCRRPILGLTDPTGDTAWALRNAGVQHIAQLEAMEETMRVLSCFLEAIYDKQTVSLIESSVQEASRLHRTRRFSELMNSLIK